MNSFTYQPQHFDIKDLLFFHVDGRGQVTAGNAAFQKAMGQGWDDLIGAQPKSWRHPTMPIGVYYKFATAMEAKEPCSGYIQTQTADGRSFWSFATNLPVDDGYVTLQLKPTAAWQDKMSGIYDTLRAEDQAEGLEGAQSAQRLDAAIEALGIPSFRDYQSTALKDEAHARQVAQGIEPDTAPEKLAALLNDIKEMESKAKIIEAVFRNTHQIPYNMRLQAGRLEGSDGPISVISANHRTMTQSLEDDLVRFGSDSMVGAETIRLALYRLSTALLVSELAASLRHEAGAHLKGSEPAVLDELASQLFGQAMLEVQSLTDRVRRFGRQCRDMRRMMSGLELTRIMCKIERSKFDEEHAGLDEIVNRLADTQVSLSDAFDTIMGLVNHILSAGEDIHRSVQRRIAQAA